LSISNPLKASSPWIPPGSASVQADEPSTDEDIADLFGQLTESGDFGSRRETARAVAERLGLTTKVVYDALERDKIGRLPE
jgi:hypothetical protein